MSTQKHKSYRKVLRIERFEKTEGSLTFPVTIVTWIIAERENSKSIFTRHLGTTVYVGPGSANLGVEAYMSTKPFRVPKSLENCEEFEVMRSRISKAYGHALYAYLGSFEDERVGQVRWFDESKGVGMLVDEQTQLDFHFYACNFDGADSVYEDRVTNVNVARGTPLRYRIDKDPFLSTHCGATHLKVAA